MIRIALVSLALLCFLPRVKSQADSSAMSDLLFYADVMVNADAMEHRERAYRQFSDLFISVLQHSGSMEEDFDSLKWVQKVYSADSVMRIFTWELRLTDDEYHYAGIIQIADPNDPMLIPLEQHRSLNSEFAPYDRGTWYGALYYGLHEFTDASGTRKFMLLGFNANDSRTNFKVADVLSFNNGRIQFGSGDFISDEGAKNRIIIEYSDGATGRMQFDRELNKLIYDHIITIPGGPEGILNVPDGSYSGYEYREGKWYYIDKVFNTVVDEPPGDGIQKPEEELDLFGRPKKNK